MMSREGAILRVIDDINNDFKERNFAGVIKSISLRAMPSENKVMQLMQTIRDFNDEHEYSLGHLDLFSGTVEKQEENNRKAVGYYVDRPATLDDFLFNRFHIENLSLYVETLEKEDVLRADLARQGADTKLRPVRSIKGFQPLFALRRFRSCRVECVQQRVKEGWIRRR